MNDAVDVTIIKPGPLVRWIVPIGMGGIALLLAGVLLVPAAERGMFAAVARIVFGLLYFGLLVVGFRHPKTRARVYADAAGIHDATTHALLFGATELQDLLFVPKGALFEVQVRKPRPFTLHFADSESALRILAPLGLTHANDSLSFLAKTTPLFYVILAWMGFPLAATFVFQAALMNGLVHAPQTAIESAGVVAVVLPCLAIWIGGTVWFSMRRHISLTDAALTYPKLFGGHESYGYAEIESIRAVDGFTLEFALRGGKRRRLTIYNTDEVNSYLAYVQARLGRPPPAESASQQVANAGEVRIARSSRRWMWVMLALSLLLGAILIPFAIYFELAAQNAEVVEGTVQSVFTVSRRGGGVNYKAVVSYPGADGRMHEIESGTESSPLAIGSHVRVLREPRFPSGAIVDDHVSRWSFAWMTLVPILCGTIAVFGLRKKKQ